ncbi:MAG: glycosyltransferase family 2 protein, partial [Polaribacter sp.]|nr:glycosyltransferase family 2 protein [Polaribacter sp.]
RDFSDRIGVSKVSGTLKGTLMAGYKILSWIFKYSFK